MTKNIGFNLNSLLMGTGGSMLGNGLSTGFGGGYGLNTIFSMLNMGCTSVNASEGCSSKRSFWTQFVLNYAPVLVRAAATGIETAIENNNRFNLDKTIKEILEEIDIKDSNTAEALKRDLTTKYKVMTSIAKQSGETLDTDEIKTRLTNYAKGWKFNQFEVKACLGLETPEFESECSKATNYTDLKAKYNQFAKEYIEFYDQDNDNVIDIEEMFYQELIEQYTFEDGLSTSEAKTKALETMQKYISNGYGLLEDGQINLPQDGSKEAEIYSLILDKLARMERTLNIKKNAAFDVEEIAVYLHAMANFKDAGNNITSSDAIHMNLSSVDEETDLFEKKLKASQNFLDSI